ncbi:hypothetical protein M231_05552 [Tremella mesenterica]|uniref:GrpE protein homolog, mitochondrial n=1 Tax=Tremella mesenterica TaxID=5217 RepID=A0A4Q1BHU3_TREME|nr:hypothetical protein M231_05552 [Tremella mesenterica]
MTRPSIVLRLTRQSLTVPIRPLPRIASISSTTHRSYFRPYSSTPGLETDGGEVKPEATQVGTGSTTEVKDGKLEVEKKATEEKIASLESRIKELEKDLLYTRAEVQTATRRGIEERQKASEFAISSFARSLLSTADDLSLALSSVPAPTSTEENKSLYQLYKGVQLTHKALCATLARNGVKPFEKILGEKFDPNLHEAVFQIPKESVPISKVREDGGLSDSEGKVDEIKEEKSEWGPGEVFDVQKEGWMIGNRVLRPAQVGVTQME